MNSLEQLVLEAQACFSKITDISSLDVMKLKYFGKSGEFIQQIKRLNKLLSIEHKTRNAMINSAKKQIEHAFVVRRNELTNIHIQKRLKTETIDVTLPGRGRNKAGIHPLMRSLERIEEIFYSIGFDITDGPEIETDWHNFSALNNPENHPARSMQDTFYIEDYDLTGKHLLLRTHTSPMQIRYALIHKPPIKVIAPGKAYRVENDATHSPMFHQIEGLWIAKDVSFAELKYIYLNFVKAFFETDDLQIRFRPSYFPFTEPSVEIDIAFKNGALKNRWLEISGAGQVHPTVMRNINLDPEQYLGFAFGSGLERLTMLRYGIHDLRLFYEGDLRFLEQFN